MQLRVADRSGGDDRPGSAMTELGDDQPCAVDATDTVEACAGMPCGFLQVSQRRSTAASYATRA